MNTKYLHKYMKEAKGWAEESSCERMQVGLVLVMNDRIRAHAYNGTVNGSDNCCEKEFFVCSYCKTEFETEEDCIVHINNKCKHIVQSINAELMLHNITYPDDVIKLTDHPKPVIELHGDDDAIIHGEINMLADCARHGIAVDGGWIVITVAPCINCANALIQAGIKGVVYDQEFNNDKGVKKLMSSGVEVIKYAEWVKDKLFAIAVPNEDTNTDYLNVWVVGNDND